MAGLPEAQEVALDTKDGERVIAWHLPPRGGKPVVLYFPGNGGALRNRVARFHELIADGNGLVALSYRGYGGSTGSPTEAGLIADAEAAYAFAAARYAAERIALWGESLGSGVAVAFGAGHRVGRIVAGRVLYLGCGCGRRARLSVFRPQTDISVKKFCANRRSPKVGQSPTKSALSALTVTNKPRLALGL
jgi:pimeloyl-ACP methyl ester carboxylesterase